MTVAVGVGVSEGVELGTNVDIKVSVGGGSHIAVWVWAAPAVATTIVWMVSRTAVGFDASGEGSPGSAHASSRNSAESKNEIFFMDCTFIVPTRAYLASNTNCTEQKCVLPTMRDHLVE